MTGFWIGWSLFVAANAWFMVCNSRTLKMRTALINRRSALLRLDRFAEHAELSDEADMVDYNEHLFALFCFRNPWLLYGPKTRALMGVTRSVSDPPAASPPATT